VNKNYEELYNKKCEDLAALEAEYNESRDLQKELETELESELEIVNGQKKKLEKDNENLKRELKDYREKYHREIHELENTNEKLTTENAKLNDKIKEKSREVIRNEIGQEELENQYREAEVIIEDLESKIDKTLEKLAIVQSELEENKCQSEEELERLKQQLKDTESEVFAYQKKTISIDMRHNILNQINSAEKVRPSDKGLKKLDINEMKIPMSPLTPGKSPIIHEKRNSFNFKFNMFDNLFKKKATNRDKDSSFTVDKENPHSARSNLNSSIGDLKSFKENFATESTPKHDKSFDSLDSKFKDLYAVKKSNKGFSNSLSIVNQLIKALDRKPKDKPTTSTAKSVLKN